jgi:hypothetical protein
MGGKKKKILDSRGDEFSVKMGIISDDDDIFRDKDRVINSILLREADSEGRKSGRAEGSIER